MKKILLFGATLFLTACGGGSDSGSDPTNPPPTPAQPENQAPQIVALPSATLNERESATFDVDASDPDGSIVSYLWEQSSGTPLTLTGEDTASLSLEVPSIINDEVVEFNVTVTDDDGAIAQQSMTVNLVNTHIEVTVSGRVTLNEISLANADVELFHANVSGQGVTDADGNYSLDILVPLDYQRSPYKLSASQGEQTVSLTGYIEDIAVQRGLDADAQIVSGQNAVSQDNKVGGSAAKANNNGSPSGDKITPLNLNEITTAEAELLESLFNSEEVLYENIYETITQFTEEYEHVGAGNVAEIAGFIVYLKDNNIPAPSPLTFSSLKTMIDEFSSSDEGFADALEQTTTTVAGNMAKTAQLKILESYPVKVFPIAASAKNTVRFGYAFKEVWEFKSDSEVTIQTGDGQVVDLNWSLENGIISWPLNVDFTRRDGVPCRREGLRTVSIIRERGNAADVAKLVNSGTNTCDDGQVDDFSNTIYVNLLTEENLKTFFDSEFSGKLIAMELPQPEQVGDNWGLFKLRFSQDGTGFVFDNNRSFDWFIENKKLIMTFSNGDSAVVYKSQNKKVGATGIVNVYTQNNGEGLIDKGAMVTVDESLIYTDQSDLVGVHRSGFDLSQPNEDVRFNFTIFLNDDNSTKFELTDLSGDWNGGYRQTGRWRLQNGMMENFITVNEYEPGLLEQIECEPFVGTCFARRYRTWEPLLKVGNRLYVHEILYNGARTYEEVISGPIVDSRLNFYEVN